MQAGKPSGEVTGPADAILPMQANPYMDQIVTGAKTYEFRKYRLRPSIKRVWFYLTAPTSSIKYICEISPARTRNPGDEPLKEDGIGNAEFNSRHTDWIGYDYAYKIDSVYEVRCPITLKEMMATYGMKSAPRGLVFVPEAIKEAVAWDQQIKLR
ncbi:hypothetical protein MMC30_007707 [Trapelia coarctata]|nr:hypothetical protein [Trapelia coarctata]